MTHPDPRPTAIPVNGRMIFRSGIALVLVGMLFLFRYSIEQGWFGPTARVTLGGVTSAALVAVGLMVSRRAYGRLLQGAGIAGGYATAWASHGRYDLVDETTALVQMVAVAAAGLALAWRERSDVLSAVGMVGAVAAPLLIGGEFVGPGGEVAYQVGALALAGALFLRRGWWMTLAVTVIGSGLVLAVRALGEDPDPVVVAGLACWWLAGWALPVFARHLGLVEADIDVVTVLTIPVPLVAWALMWSATGQVAPVGAALAAFGAATHFGVWAMSRRSPESAVQLLTGIAFAVVALLIWFEPATAVPVYLALSLALCVYGSRVADTVVSVIGAAAAALALPAWLTIIEETGSFTLGAAMRDLASVIIVATAAVLIPRSPIRSGAATTAYVMALVWIAVHPAYVDPGWATAGFAVLGLVSLVVGRVQRSRLLAAVGLGTVAMAVGKLILVDLATAHPLLKIGLAFGIGIALLAVGYWVGDAAVLTEAADTEDT